MDRLFLINGPSRKRFSYNELIECLNTKTTYFPNLRTNDISDFYINFLAAIISEQPITLIDSDVSDKEIARYFRDGAKTLNKFSEILIDVESIEDLVCKIKNSKSIITLFTSGTTGQPKKVSHTISNLIRNVKQGEKFERNIWALAYNPSHMAGLQVFFQAILNRNSLINLFNRSKLSVVDQIKTYGITNVSATPTFYRMLLPPDFTAKSVRRVTVGGEMFSQELCVHLEKMFPNTRIRNIYASTEAGTLFTANSVDFVVPDDLLDKVKLVEGELLIHTSLTGETDFIRGEWYETGDFVDVINKQPLTFRFMGRRNEIINIGGYKVNPIEIEEILKLHSQIKNAIIYARYNSVLGNMLICEIEKFNDSKLSERAIRNFLGDKIQAHKIPRIFRFVDKIETTPTGKTKRR